MKRYLAEIFGLSVKIENWDGKSKLPLYLRNKREYFVLSIGDVQSVLMKNSSDNFNVSGFEKEMQEIEKYSGMSVILWLEAISTYQRNALVKNRIPFIVPNSQIYVPELGMCLKEFCAGKREKVEKMTATTQFLLLYFIYQKKHEEKSQSELAEHLNMSAMNVSRAVQELQELALLDVRKEGTSKLVKSVAIGKELLIGSSIAYIGKYVSVVESICSIVNRNFVKHPLLWHALLFTIKIFYGNMLADAQILCVRF